MNAAPPPLSGVPPKLSGLAVTSLVLGILGLFLGFCVGPVLFVTPMVPAVLFHAIGVVPSFCAGPVLFAIPAILCGHIAYSRIKNSGGQLQGKGTAIRGFVTGYVGLAFFVLVTAIYLPGSVRMLQRAPKSACINNLRVIDGAKQKWVQEHPDKKDSVPSPAELDPYLKDRGGFSSLKCPAGGTYEINAPTAAPTCSIPDHRLD
jgi:hypothetical protein